MTPNNAAALDAAMPFSSRIGRHLRGASELTVSCDMKLYSILLGGRNLDQALRVSAGTPRKHASGGRPRKVSGLLSEV